MVSDNFGDFQTPIEFTLKVVRFLKGKGISPDSIIEPTFGTGHFILSALEVFENISHVIGVEVQKKYLSLLQRTLPKTRSDVQLIHGNIFDMQSRILPPSTSKDILVIGNPPWVTNTHLSKLNSDNLPAKTSDKSDESGISLLTGSSNFDIAESILTYLLETFKERKTTIAMLCKTTVNHKLLMKAKKYRWKIVNWEFFIISRKIFGVNVDAGLLLIQTDPKIPAEIRNYSCRIDHFQLDQKELLRYKSILGRETGWVNGKNRPRFVFDKNLYLRYAYLESKNHYSWRQGIKHDLNKIIVLEKTLDSLYLNLRGEYVDVEPCALMPFMKGSQVYNYSSNSPAHRYIILTQTNLQQNPEEYLQSYPKTLAYLSGNIEEFSKRKSRVYSKRHPFSMFGIGDYSFSMYKVAIASMYSKPRFQLIEPIDGKPVLLDDTCYFIPFDNFEDAQETLEYLNSEEVQNFLDAISFPFDKRKYKIKVLKRISKKL